MVCKELAQLNDFNPNTIKGINWRCATNRMKEYCHQVYLRQTPWDFRCNYQMYSYNGSQIGKEIEKIWFSPLPTMSSTCFG